MNELQTTQPTALAQVTPTFSIMPTNTSELKDLAHMIAGSQLFAVKSVEAAAVILMTGLELGFSPVQSCRGIHVVSGKPVLSADMMMAACLNKRGVCEYFGAIESSDAVATYATKRTGRPETRHSFSIDEAKRAGLMSNPTWNKYPAQMLRARCISGLARMVYPDILLGLYTPDEISNSNDPDDKSFEPVFTPPPAVSMTRPADVVIRQDPTVLTDDEAARLELRSTVYSQIKGFSKEFKDEVQTVISTLFDKPLKDFTVDEYLELQVHFDEIEARMHNFAAARAEQDAAEAAAAEVALKAAHETAEAAKAAEVVTPPAVVPIAVVEEDDPFSEESQTKNFVAKVSTPMADARVEIAKRDEISQTQKELEGQMAPNFPASLSDGDMRCDVCKKVLNKPTFDLGMRNYGRGLCMAHQVDAKKKAEAS